MSTNTILNQIILYKKEWISHQQNNYPLHILQSTVQKSTRNFYKTLFNNKNKTNFILEYKQASPSKGIICKKPNLIKIANIYKYYASVISVVTDEKYFHGNHDMVSKISNVVTQPILCKDFFISEWQIYFARLYKSDAILLMLSVLDDDTYQKFCYIAHKLHMGVLTEISNKKELNRAISLNATVIGINNRNLHDLSIDLNRTINLSQLIPKSIITISESGITSNQDIKKLKKYVNGFLIGTSLMSQDKLKMAVNKLILGENKICGITRTNDAKLVYKLGSIYGGFIFVKQSPRYINPIDAKYIILSITKLNYVGVFCNEDIDYIINIVKKLKLYAVQLHGTENQNYINQLRTKLSHSCQIWKSINMHQKPLPQDNLLHVDRYLLDNQSGGSGIPFNWAYLSYINLGKSILAGGLTIHNCKKASELGCLGLDFNSGVESSPGIKNHQKLIKIFQILRTY